MFLLDWTETWPQLWEMVHVVLHQTRMVISGKIISYLTDNNIDSYFGVILVLVENGNEE